jgi:hypothetical protein
MVPAARTAETRNPQGAPQKRELALTVFGGNALHLKIATVAAVCRKHKSNRHHPSVEAPIAGRTTPRAQSSQPNTVVKRALAA